MRRRIAAVVAVAAVAACSSASDEPESTPTSAATWPTGSPEDAGFNGAALDDLNQHLEASDSSCFVVVRDGTVVNEEYWGKGSPTQARPVFSITKSMTSVLVGIAEDKGELDLDDPAADYISEWVGTPADDITVRDLLANVSGREWDLETDYQKMAVQAEDKTAFALGLDQDHEPGTVWAYNNSAIQTLSLVLQKATGQGADLLGKSEIFNPLGMANTSWASDQAGNAMTYAGVSSTCLDLARFGQMMLDGGEWDGQRVVPEAFVDESTGKSSSDLNAAYGLLWWVNQPGRVVGALQATDPKAKQGADADTRLAPRAPDDAYWALGLGGQSITVIPSLDLVAVRLGVQPADEEAVSPDRIAGDLAAALKSAE